ncbi:tRNA pseudouridine synthase 1 [Puccinia graminis f. sp. tritici]|uniref:tRNA pseudouridylate synthase 2 n=1 Tax=Puccinia graminis f. sp. tritici TaxID=56615 RepID=A0A5B0SGJ5_PUCGR|nr:tRNA pseudouridine synthase 1 [Puccinia graminis f. sp. tritici]
MEPTEQEQPTENQQQQQPQPQQQQQQHLKRKPEQEPTTIDGALSRLPKRRVAIMIGYYGRGYQGSQINPGTKTIEGTLFNAFVRAGCITQDNSTHPNKVGLQRAARTDANVSACCNLISLKLILNPPEIGHDKRMDQVEEEGQEDALHKSLIEQHSQTSYYPLIKHINRFLPSDMKIWEIIRVQNSFNPRSFCDSRVYEYSLPTWLFLPPKPGSPLHQRLMKLNQNCIKKTGEEEEEAEKEEDPEANWWNDHSNLLEKDFKSIQAERRGCYRISQMMIARIKSVLDQFRGTHNFHNLTVGKAFTERNAVRIMKDFTVSQPFLVGGSDPTNPKDDDDHQPLENPPTEWISITFHGQSFMLHQIRKMIGLLVLVCRTRTPVSIIKQLYGPRKVSIPKAPGIGLILRKLNFHGYNKKIQHINEQTLQRRNKKRKGARNGGDQDDDQLMIWDSIECDRFEALFERFKLETLFNRIFLNQTSQISNEPQDSNPITGDQKVDPVELDTVKEEESGSKNSKPTSTKPPKSSRAAHKDDDDDEEIDEEDEDDDVVPVEKLEGEDPFGVWMNYLDVYTGPDLDFLNPDGILPDDK